MAHYLLVKTLWREIFVFRGLHFIFAGYFISFFP